MSDEKNRPVKAYKNLDFLNGPDARIIRMMCEFLEPQSRFRDENIRRTIVFFGSARIRSKEESLATVESINRELLTQGDGESELQQQLKVAEHQLLMSNYYEEAVETARLLTEWLSLIHI